MGASITISWGVDPNLPYFWWYENDVPTAQVEAPGSLPWYYVPPGYENDIPTVQAENPLSLWWLNPNPTPASEASAQSQYPFLAPTEISYGYSPLNPTDFGNTLTETAYPGITDIATQQVFNWGNVLGEPVQIGPLQFFPVGSADPMVGNGVIIVDGSGSIAGVQFVPGISMTDAAAGEGLFVIETSAFSEIGSFLGGLAVGAPEIVAGILAPIAVNQVLDSNATPGGNATWGQVLLSSGTYGSWAPDVSLTVAQQIINPNEASTIDMTGEPQLTVAPYSPLTSSQPSDIILQSLTPTVVNVIGTLDASDFVSVSMSEPDFTSSTIQFPDELPLNDLPQFGDLNTFYYGSDDNYGGNVLGEDAGSDNADSFTDYDTGDDYYDGGSAVDSDTGGGGGIPGGDGGSVDGGGGSFSGGVSLDGGDNTDDYDDGYGGSTGSGKPPIL